MVAEVADKDTACERVVGGRYFLYDEIGAGGMATVQIGRLRGAGGFMRTVAIKRLHPALVRDSEVVSMLIDEARLAARIQHPNVVQTLDVVVEQRELFIVMEYIHGESLSQLLRQHFQATVRIPFWIVATMLVDVLRGLHAAHETKDEQGRCLELVHRDISPQNIIVGADGLTRVLDFGIAQSRDSLHVSQAGTLRGKCSYVSPEQISEAYVSKRADIYSASVVLWECLTGKRLFQAQSPQAILAQVLSGNIAAPSQIVPELPTAFDAVVLRGLARNPAERFESAKDMAEELGKCCRLASHANVAAWLSKEAHARLNQRADCLARIERNLSSERHLALRELLGDLVPHEGAWLGSHSAHDSKPPVSSDALGQTEELKCTLILHAPAQKFFLKASRLSRAAVMSVLVATVVAIVGAIVPRRDAAKPVKRAGNMSHMVVTAASGIFHRQPEIRTADVVPIVHMSNPEPVLSASSSVPNSGSSAPRKSAPSSSASRNPSSVAAGAKSPKASDAFRNLGGRL
jgi:serine/threonine-protein kinase